MRRRKHRFSEESANPMHCLSNLSDAILMLAVGMMLALIVHWNVDLSAGGKAEPADGQSRIDRDQAVTFTPEAPDIVTSEPQDAADGLEKLGEVYYDAATGKYYIIENGKS